MARGRGKSGTRREPVFDAAPPVEIAPDDRPAAAGAASPAPRRRSPRKRKTRSRGGGRKRALITRSIYWALVVGLWLAIGGVGTVAWVGAHLPPIQSLEIPKRPPSIQIVDDEGHVLAVRGDAGGAVLTLKELPSYLPQAFIAIEDRRFYEHYGVDPFGIGRAVRCQHFAPRHQPGRINNHAAIGEESLFDSRAYAHAQAAGDAAGAVARAQISPRRKFSNCI